MKAWQLYCAAYDSACDYQQDTVEYIKQYADGAFDMHVSDAIAQKILDCRLAFIEAPSELLSSDYFWHTVEKPLKSIEI